MPPFRNLLQFPLIPQYDLTSDVRPSIRDGLRWFFIGRRKIDIVMEHPPALAVIFRLGHAGTVNIECQRHIEYGTCICRPENSERIVPAWSSGGILWPEVPPGSSYDDMRGPTLPTGLNSVFGVAKECFCLSAGLS